MVLMVLFLILTGEITRLLLLFDLGTRSSPQPSYILWTNVGQRQKKAKRAVLVDSCVGGLKSLILNDSQEAPLAQFHISAQKNPQC